MDIQADDRRRGAPAPTASTAGQLTADEAHLVAQATAVRDHAYAPYSRFAVGAAVRVAGGSGAIFTGCNVENASFGLTCCAERNAVFQAVAAGHRHLEAVAVVTDAPTPTMPCGACRQVLREFGPTMAVIGATIAGTVARFRLDDLLPGSFGPEDLPA